MKANVPEKIYISPKVFNIGVYVTKVLTTKYEDNIEYTRTDAFIEKATKWLYLQLNEINMEGEDMNNFLKDFRNYMKEE